MKKRGWRRGVDTLLIVVFLISVNVAARSWRFAAAEPSLQSDESARQAGVRSLIHRPVEVDPQWPLYHPPARQVTGTIHIVGGVATLPLVERLAEALEDWQPALQVQARSVETTRTPAWWEITEQPTLAVLSEQMTTAEENAFEKQWGYKPTHLPIALDPVVVVVHPSNPVAERGLTLSELDAIFSQTRNRGLANIRSWGELGLHGQWAERPIALYGHDASASLFLYFRRMVLQHGDFKSEVARQPGSGAVVYNVAQNPDALGYAGLSFADVTIAVAPLAAGPDHTAVAPTQENLRSQRYPLPHAISLYLNWKPESVLDAPRREVLRLIYSRQGQQLMADSGYFLIAPSSVLETLQRLDIALDRQDPRASLSFRKQ